MTADEIRIVLAAKADALVRRSADDLAALLHPDFVYVNASGRKLDKAVYIDVGCISGRLIFRDQQVSELDVRQFDDFAVATMLLNDRFVFEGKEVAETYRSLCVFSKKAGHWQWIAGQTMRPPSP
jgi:ketosteroid isomerase-like protein